jgi:hypothetical protein
LNGRREPPLQIRIRGLNLGEAKEHIESEIRHIVVEELVENALARWRGAWLEPQDQPPADDGPAISVSLVGLSLPQSLGGLDLPPADARRIEAQVQQRIQALVAPYTPPRSSATDPDGDALGPTIQSHGGPSSCICVHNTPTNQMKILAPDGTLTTDLSVLDPLIPPPPRPYRLGILPNAWDEIAMTVSRSVVFPSDRMSISLTSQTQWAKALEAWNFCAGRQAEVFQGGPSTVPNEMTIFDGCGPGHTDTLNFNRPGWFFGIWGTVWRPNESDFWATLRGRRVDFDWVRG